MIVMQKEEEVVNTRANKRFHATHGAMVAETRVWVANLSMAIITKASYYVILDAKVNIIVSSHVYIVIFSTLIDIHGIETNISEASVAIAVGNIYDA